jgi:hypothetical protein
MPALGNKWKVFCPFVEYHRDSAVRPYHFEFEKVSLHFHYIIVNTIFRRTLIFGVVCPPGGSCIAFLNRRPGAGFGMQRHEANFGQ